jgi:hypothetical protein
MLPRELSPVKLTIEIIKLNNEIRFQLQNRRGNFVVAGGRAERKRISAQH